MGATSLLAFVTVKEVWKDVKLGLCCELGDGSSTRFWIDIWLPSVGPLKLLAFRDIPDEEASLPVKIFVDRDGNWKWHMFKNDLSVNVISLKAGRRTPRIGDGETQCLWDHTTDGIFSVASTYEVLCEEEWVNPCRSWDTIWKWVDPYEFKSSCGLHVGIAYPRTQREVDDILQKVIYAPFVGKQLRMWIMFCEDVQLQRRSRQYSLGKTILVGVQFLGLSVGNYGILGPSPFFNRKIYKARETNV